MGFVLMIKENLPNNTVSFGCDKHGDHSVSAEVHFWRVVKKVFRPRKRPLNEYVEMVTLRCPVCKTSEDYEFKGLVYKEQMVLNGR